MSSVAVWLLADRKRSLALSRTAAGWRARLIDGSGEVLAIWRGRLAPGLVARVSMYSVPSAAAPREGGWTDDDEEDE